MCQSDLARAARVPQPNRSPNSEVVERIEHALAGRMLCRVEQHRDGILALVAEHHAESPRIFGSVARGDDEPGSDLDLLVEFTDEATLLDEVGLRLALSDLLRVEVDIVAGDALHGDFGERVLREAVAV